MPIARRTTPSSSTSSTKEDDYAAALLSVQDGLNLFVDDTQLSEDAFTFSATWSVESDASWAGGTQTVFSPAADSKEEGSFEITAYGTPLSIVGSAPSSLEGHTFWVTVNEKAPVQASFYPEYTTTTSSNSTTTTPIDNPALYRAWYTLYLPDVGPRIGRLFRIKFSGLPRGTGVDFAVVGAHEQQAVLGKTLVVDDNARGVLYTGEWQAEKAGEVSVGGGGGGGGGAVGGGVHRSAAGGGEVSMTFVGTGVSVFGAYEVGASAKYTLDGGVEEELAYTTPPSKMALTNFLLYSVKDLEPALHRLTITVPPSSNTTSNATSSSLFLDYLTYSPAFDSLEWLRHQKDLSNLKARVPEKKTIRGGMLAGIVVGVIFGVLVLTCLICCKSKRKWCRRRVRRWKRRRAGGVTTTVVNLRGSGSGSEKDGSRTVSDGKLDSSRSPHFSFKKAHASKSFTQTFASSVLLPEKDSKDPDFGSDTETPKKPAPVYLNLVVRVPQDPASTHTSPETPNSTKNAEILEEPRTPTATTTPSSRAAEKRREEVSVAYPAPVASPPRQRRSRKKESSSSAGEAYEMVTPSAPESSMVPFPTSPSASSSASAPSSSRNVGHTNAVASSSKQPSLYTATSPRYRAHSGASRAERIGQEQRESFDTTSIDTAHIPLPVQGRQRRLESLQAELNGLAIIATEGGNGESGRAMAWRGEDTGGSDKGRVARMAELVREIEVSVLRGVERGGRSGRGVDAQERAGIQDGIKGGGEGEVEGTPDYQVGVAI
ncbi:hypothetical protein DFP72DRAFT_1146409 [Ephemerocybe angulata]|uniref:Uncharacterized protein n=1 Tax=Ephemerocybe angulata TaxID=980116 RepID=A0A8H6LZY5_9AGAR|nr:hypothetical protein DFP72DRAFT_1146409 [Tulosesus angulatus]